MAGSTESTREHDEARIDVLGEGSFAVEGDVHLLVTFLNKMLKDRGLIFGLTRARGEAKVTVYEVVGPKK